MNQDTNMIINSIEEGNTLVHSSSPISVDAKKLPNALLQRLIEEVKYDSQNNISAYNRTHSRHNRGR